MNHAPYQQLIAKYVAKGVELAGMIDMPDGNTTGVTRMESTIAHLPGLVPFGGGHRGAVVDAGRDAGRHDRRRRRVPPAGEAQNVPLVVAAKSEGCEGPNPTYGVFIFVYTVCSTRD